LLQLAQIANLPGFGAQDFQTYLKAAWQEIQKKTGDKQPFKEFWKRSLQAGGIFQPFKPVKVALSPSIFSKNLDFQFNSDQDLILLPVNSGLHNSNARGGNKSWLLEIPHPVTQIAWDSWVEMHPETAIKYGIKHGELVDITTSQGSAKAAAFLFDGINPQTIAMPIGLGRTLMFPGYKSRRSKFRFLPVLESKSDRKPKKIEVGVNVATLLPFNTDSLSGDLAFTTPVTIKSTGIQATVAAVDGQYRADIESPAIDSRTGLGDRGQKGRGFIQTTTLDILSGKVEAEDHGHHLRKRQYTLSRKNKRSFYDPMDKNVKDHLAITGKEQPRYYDPYKWEMIVDLDKCTGCSACVVSCYAENNIPVVGKDRMVLGREMSWLRIERYFEHNQETNAIETYYSPQMCAQCDNAGCEPVCPVFATYQTPDGLNAMIYNRCVGTRYCSNNCIFKQRRFNFRTYDFPSPLHMQLNPAVTVREKGIMEKCTFCHQRIREQKDLVKDQGRDIRDGEIQTACQQACPADAITFGNVMDKNSLVSRRKSETKRGYVQLEELNYQPAVHYLKKINHNHRKA